jgi:hypothetical protein
LEYKYSPFPILAVRHKTRASRTVRDALADGPRLNSNGKIVRSTAEAAVRWAGRTVRQGYADCPPGPRGLSAGWPRTVCPGPRAAPRSVANNGPSAAPRGPSAWSRRTVRLVPADRPPGSAFSRNLLPKTQLLNKNQRPADRPPEGPGLSARNQKTCFSFDFQRKPFTKRNRHSSKCNACKLLIQVALWKVKPMKLIPLDSTAIYPINPVI